MKPSFRRPITSAIKDVRWAAALAGGLTEHQWREAFRAGGYAPDVAGRFIEILRARIADAERAHLVAQTEQAGTGPGGHCGATQESSAVDLPPHIDTSDQPLPGPAKPTLRPAPPARKTLTPTPLKATG